MKFQDLNLFITSHCHLCDQAEKILNDLAIDCVTLIEIAEDMQLIGLYGLRIPVLQRKDTKAELNWPFTANDVIAFLHD